MIKIINKETRAILGTISEEEFQFLIDQLEEEGISDNDYYVNQETLDYFSEQGLSGQLMDILKKGLGNQEEMDIEWMKE